MTTLSFELPYIDNSLAYETIYTCPLLACMLKTNPLAGKKSIELSELKDQEFIFNSPQVFPSYFKYYSQLCYESGFGPKITKYVNSPHSLIWNIQNDNEVLLCDMFIRDIESPLISRVEIKGQTSSLVTFWKKDNNNPLIRMFAVLDRRIGKRTLAKAKESIAEQPLWLRQFYQLRITAEGL
jgi:hypothetical protein